MCREEMVWSKLQNRISYQGRALSPGQLPFQQLPDCVVPRPTFRSRVVFYLIFGVLN